LDKTPSTYKKDIDNIALSLYLFSPSIYLYLSLFDSLSQFANIYVNFINKVIFFKQNKKLFYLILEFEMFLDKYVIIGVILPGLDCAVVDVALTLHVSLQFVVRITKLIKVKKFN
jgi:hypothetical protein